MSLEEVKKSMTTFATKVRLELRGWPTGMKQKAPLIHRGRASIWGCALDNILEYLQDRAQNFP
jgi:hypothetical protein